jgi:hypothetical protein
VDTIILLCFSLGPGLTWRVSYMNELIRLFYSSFRMKFFFLTLLFWQDFEGMWLNMGKNSPLILFFQNKKKGMKCRRNWPPLFYLYLGGLDCDYDWTGPLEGNEVKPIPKRSLCPERQLFGWSLFSLLIITEEKTLRNVK